MYMLKLFYKIPTALLERFAIQKIWEYRGFAAWLLLPLSLLFWAIASMRRLSFRWGFRKTEYLPVPVVVVGNVRVGGTGKTPIVIALVQALSATGWKPGVISRGYGARFVGVRSVSGQEGANEVGDEPLLIAQRTQIPLWIGKDRVAAGRALCAAHPEVNIIISDDGLQHYRLGRDIELVVFDQRLGGNGFLLPAGPLRESLHRRRDATLINQNASISSQQSEAQLSQAARQCVDAPTFSVQLQTGLAWHLTDPLEHCALSTFATQKVWAAAGIGAPERFFDTLRQHGIQPTVQAFPDHFVYLETTFLDIDAQVILITEKDAVKCRAVLPFVTASRVWVVPVDAVLEPGFIDFVLQKLKAISA